MCRDKSKLINNIKNDMAERRMISKKIADSDLFIDMSLSSQALYFHLLLRADDEGFVGNPKMVMRIIRCNEDDFKVLLAKQFVMTFPSGICVIKHWYTHNYIQKDRFTDSQYIEEKELLRIRKDRVYVSVNEKCIQSVYKLGTKVSGGKDSSVQKSKKIDKVDLPSWLDLDAWNMWLDHRKEMGKPLSSNGMKIQLEQLSNFTKFHVEMIHRSIESGYSRLFENDYEEDDDTDQT